MSVLREFEKKSSIPKFVTLDDYHSERYSFYDFGRSRKFEFVISDENIKQICKSLHLNVLHSNTFQLENVIYKKMLSSTDISH